MGRRGATRPFLAALSALALCACGYGFTQRWVAKGGAERVHVRAFENLSTEPGLGVAVTSSLRSELARRGAEAGEGAAAAIEGEVRATEPVPTSQRAVTTAAGAPATEIATWRIAVEVRARLVQGGAKLGEHVVRREAAFLAGADPLETEGRRALALRQLADEAAREVLRAFER
ncbi:MAG TPA: LPS assembly lipoprotein LptE [Anaeromyxobacter sp.]